MNLEFKPLHETDIPQMLALYESSFPAEERRPYADADDFKSFIHSKSGKFKILGAYRNGSFCGFLSYWNFKKFHYIEHFAISPLLRNKGTGSRMLGEFSRCHPCVLLEVELPDNPDACRRIDFYRKSGFVLHDETKYIQPPYSADGKPVEMLLMTFGDINIEDPLVLDLLFTEVYNIKTN